jgi:DNA gyrase/topoisomerase IV subunit B
VTNVSAKRAMESATIYSIFSVIGLGLDVNNVVKDCNTREEAIEVVKQKTRYGKIIIATDADADGSQIANELLHMFGKYASFMVDLGLIYRAISPLWKGKSKTTGKMTYYYPDDPYNQDTGFPVDMDEHSHYYRYKGLTI